MIVYSKERLNNKLIVSLKFWMSIYSYILLLAFVAIANVMKVDMENQNLEFIFHVD